MQLLNRHCDSQIPIDPLCQALDMQLHLPVAEKCHRALCSNTLHHLHFVKPSNQQMLNHEWVPTGEGILVHAGRIAGRDLLLNHLKC